MAQKFGNSSKSAFVALALLDFSPFVITKPQIPVSAKLDHRGRNESHFVNFYIGQISQFSKMFQFCFFAAIFNPLPIVSFLS